MTDRAEEILIVDDESDIRMILRLGLSRAGFRVREAAGGHEALAAIEDREPGLVILDLRMPPPDGWAVVRQLHDDGMLPRLPVVVLSAHVSDDSRERALAAGCRAYMPKPFRLKDVVETSRDLLGPGQPGG